MAASRPLAKQGKLDRSSIHDVGSMGVGVAVRRGAPKPDIHDVAAFKKAMMAARSVMYADPAKGGQSGIPHRQGVRANRSSTRISRRSCNCASAVRTA